MEQRARFVLEALQKRFSMSELCERYGVSRKTGYKWIQRYHPWPCPSTIGEIFKRYELVRKRRRRSARSTWRPARTIADRANRVWTADFKGQFRLGNGALCYPLTILDAYSRYLLLCQGLKGTASRPARRAFEQAFRQYGLPDVIRTDNGVPFCAPTSILGSPRCRSGF